MSDPPDTGNSLEENGARRPIDELQDGELEASIIHQRVIEAISDIVPDTAKEDLAGKVISIITEEIETYSGFVPHPRHAEHWEKVAPGSAKRILRLAERRAEMLTEQARIEERMHAAEIGREDSESRRLAAFKMGGLITGFLLGALMICGAIFSALHGQAALALALVGASALGTIGYFINSQWHPGPSE